MLKERKEKDNKYNAEHFVLDVNGIHPQQIPSFYNSKKEWWKARDGYVENPKHKSQAQMKQDNKLWSRNDQMLLADFTDEEAPKDPFRAYSKQLKSKEKLSEKPNNIKNVKHVRKVKRTRCGSTRWSEKEGKV